MIKTEIGGHNFNFLAIYGSYPGELHVSELLIAVDDSPGFPEDTRDCVLNRHGPPLEAAGEVACGPVIAVPVQLGAAGSAVAPTGPEGQGQPEAPTEEDVFAERRQLELGSRGERGQRSAGLVAGLGKDQGPGVGITVRQHYALLGVSFACGVNPRGK